MSDSITANKAADYISKVTGRRFEEKPVVDENGNILVNKQTNEQYTHGSVANDLLKIVNMTPRLSRTCKAVISMKIINPTLTDFEIAFRLAVREYDVPKYIQYAKHAINAFLASTSVEEARNKFNSERTVETAVKNLNKTKNNPLLI